MCSSLSLKKAWAKLKKGGKKQVGDGEPYPSWSDRTIGNKHRAAIVRRGTGKDQPKAM